MPTSIYKYDGTLLTTVADSTLDSTHSTLRFPGKGYQNYGQPVLENLVWIMQNFASATAPNLPLTGQCWYDTTTKTIRVYNGITWDSAGGVTIAGAAPTTAASQGELWFDSVNQQLNTWNGTSWSLLGPLGSAINADPLNKAIPSNSTIDSIRISDGTLNHQVWRITVGGTLLAIISKDAAFTPATPINGFATISPGINLNTNIPNNGLSGSTNAFTNDKTNTPSVDASYDLGSITNRFSNFYSINGLFSSAIAINAAIGSYTLEVSGDTYLNGGAVVNGGTNVAPIVIQSGNLTVTPTLGAIEFDGRDFYITGNVNNTTSRVSLTAASRTFGSLSVSNTTPATSTTTGALVVAGGVGIGGNVHVGGNLDVNDSVNAFGDLYFSGNIVPGPGVSNVQILVPGNDNSLYPGLAWGNDRDTGLYTPAFGTVAISINGSQVIRFNANGSIGIGTTNNRGTAGQVLTSNGTGAAVSWAFANPNPPGAVIAFAGQTAPSGWLLCQGQAVSRTVYADLFAAIGTTYGVGDNSTTFNLPDLRGEFIRGFDAGRGVDVGRAFGSAQADAFKSHSHDIPHNFDSATAGDFISGNDGPNNTPGTASPTAAVGGSETRPRNVAMQYIIKT